MGTEPEGTVRSRHRRPGAAPWNSIPTTPGPTTIWASPWPAQGRLAESIAPWETALKANDQIPEVRKNLVGALENLGVAALRKGNLDRGVAAPAAGRRTGSPGYRRAVQPRSGAVARIQSFDEAIAHFQRALALDPGDAQTHNDLAVALAQKRRFEEAAAQFRQAIASDPGFAQAQSNLAWLLATSPAAAIRNGGEAVKLAERAVDLSRGKDASMLDALAAAYAEAGRFPEAVETAQRALALAPKPLIPALKARLAMYQRREPFREK